MMSLVTDIKIALHEIVYSNSKYMDELICAIRANAGFEFGDVSIVDNHDMGIIILNQALHDNSILQWSDIVSNVLVEITNQFSSEIYDHIKNRYAERGMVVPSELEVANYCPGHSNLLFHITRTNNDLIVHL